MYCPADNLLVPDKILSNRLEAILLKRLKDATSITLGDFVAQGLDDKILKRPERDATL